MAAGGRESRWPKEPNFTSSHRTEMRYLFPLLTLRKKEKNAIRGHFLLFLWRCTPIEAVAKKVLWSPEAFFFSKEVSEGALQNCEVIGPVWLGRSLFNTYEEAAPQFIYVYRCACTNLDSAHTVKIRHCRELILLSLSPGKWFCCFRQNFIHNIAGF